MLSLKNEMKKGGISKRYAMTRIVGRADIEEGREDIIDKKILKNKNNNLTKTRCHGCSLTRFCNNLH